MSTNTPTPPSTTDAETTEFDWQGHRGARGLLPENTIPAFIKALEFSKVKTLELDVVVAKGGSIIISHEPWFSEKICSKPDRTPVSEEEAKTLKIYDMTYEQIKQYDCGSRGNERFPEQKAMAIYKPSFMDMVSNVELHCEKQQLPKPEYNIELKSQPEYYGVMTPAPQEFVRYLLDEIDLLNIKERVTLQSFDLNILQEIRKQDSTVVTALLIENMNSVQENIDKLGWIPHKYSPYYMLLNEKVIKEIHDLGMLVVPWTVNDPEVMSRLKKLGVDGIITDYPNLIPE
ncbi:MAG: glycerophosphodiester phosphodiesterase family protein [Bacteroidota bacterium]